MRKLIGNAIKKKSMITKGAMYFLKSLDVILEYSKGGRSLLVMGRPQVGQFSAFLLILFPQS